MPEAIADNHADRQDPSAKLPAMFSRPAAADAHNAQQLSPRVIRKRFFITDKFSQAFSNILISTVHQGRAGGNPGQGVRFTH